MFGKTQTNKVDTEVFVIHDSKGATYWLPEYALNKHDMIRKLTNLFTNPDQQRGPLVQNSEDFSCFKIGEYSRYTGEFTPCKQEHVCNLIDLRTMVRSQNSGVVPT